MRMSAGTDFIATARVLRLGALVQRTAAPVGPREVRRRGGGASIATSKKSPIHNGKRRFKGLEASPGDFIANERLLLLSVFASQHHSARTIAIGHPQCVADRVRWQSGQRAGLRPHCDEVFAASPRNASPSSANLPLFCAELPMFASVSLVVWMCGKLPPLALPASKKYPDG